MTDNDRAEELPDRLAIHECLFRYCRGIDRADEESLRRAYWPDGHDTHGSYVGNVEGFIQWAMMSLKNFERSIHQIHNTLIDFQDTGAAVESYFTAFQRYRVSGKRQQDFLMGRYVDWFEKRSNEWRIARRVVVFDWVEVQTHRR
ncbi:hypothetical protein CYD30_28780 [Kosakonia cowanii]|nr:hypothetical protein CYD30_28780 [Kosakonia cowanii]